jgi:hypothetical protein
MAKCIDTLKVNKNFIEHFGNDNYYININIELICDTVGTSKFKKSSI